MGDAEPGNPPYLPTIQADAAISGGISHEARAIKDRRDKQKHLTAEQQYGAGLNIPRCSMQSYSGVILATNTPQLVLQSNPLRTSLLIANPNPNNPDDVPGNTFTISFNSPAFIGPQALDTGLNLVDGMPLAPGEKLPFLYGGAVPFNEIWISGAAGVHYTIYEAMPLGGLFVS